MTRSTHNILLVDDDEALLDGIRRGLRRNFAIDTAASPELALRMISRQGPYAVIVADMQMPRMDGATFLAAARGVNPDSIRMMLTGSACLETALEAVNNGNVFRFMTKPCPLPELANFLEAGLRQHALQLAERRAAVLEEANRAKSNFLTTVSHELRTPLTILRLAAEVLDHSAVDQRKRSESVAAVISQTQRLSEMVDQLMDMVQLDAGLVRLDESTLDLRVFLQEVVHTLSTDLCPVALRIDCPDQPATCLGDSTYLRKAFVQLIDNAQKFSPAHAKVTVTLCSVENGYVVGVRDYGPGLQPSELQNAFEPFVQRDEVLVDKPAGLGLGLAVVKKVLDLHGASVTYTDAPEGGAIFSVHIPGSATRSRL